MSRTSFRNRFLNMATGVLMQAEDYYFYSFTDRRCVIHTGKRGEFAWCLEPAPTELPKGHDVFDLSEQYIVTREYGQYGRLKVESRIFRQLWDALSWASWIEDQNPGKKVTVWKIIDKTVDS